MSRLTAHQKAPPRRPARYHATVRRRRLFTLCSALSLLLCAALAVMWLRSNRTEDHLGRVGANKVVIAASVNGLVVVGGYRIAETVQPQSGWRYGNRPADPVPWTALFRLPKYRSGDDVRAWSVVIPYWIPVLAALVLPLRWLLWQIRVRRLKPGLCPVCGYDLRASSGRCPECGTAVGAKA